LLIYASRDDDISEGFVWLPEADLPARAIVKITNPGTGDSVVCEALQLDANFIRQYNHPPRFSIADGASAVVMSSWYRARLGNLQTQRDYALRIERADALWHPICACMHHPQVIVRVAAWLAVLSVGLGLLGVVLGAISLWATP
jgi:hypothetical protein